MKNFLLISAVIFTFTLSVSGCSKAPDNQKAATNQPVKEAVKTATPEATKPAPPKTEAPPAPAGQIPAQPDKPAAASPARDLGSKTVADIIEMKNTTAFSKHTRGIAMFTHKKHIAPPPDGHGLDCGECHHDKNGQPLALKQGDFVQGCIACHDKPGKPRKQAGMSAEDWKALELEYYYGAIHTNCIDCHKARKAGPVKCKECHPKEEKPNT